MDTSRMFAMYDEMSLPELAEQLELLDERRTPVGWSTQDAVHRSTLERRFVDRVSHGRGGPRTALECRLEIQMRSREQARAATLVEIADGGLAIETESKWILGTVVDIGLSSADEHGLRIRARIDVVEGTRLALSIVEPTTDAQERRIQRFLREAIRHRSHS